LYSQIMKSCIFVFSSGLGSEPSFLLWDNIALTSAKDDLIQNLHLISSEIEDIAVTGHPDIKGARQFKLKNKNKTEKSIFLKLSSLFL